MQYIISIQNACYPWLLHISIHDNDNRLISMQVIASLS